MFFFSSLSLIFLSVLELVINFNTLKKKSIYYEQLYGVIQLEVVCIGYTLQSLCATYHGKFIVQA